MARIKLVARSGPRRPKLRPVLVASLLLRNPTTTVEAVPGGVTTRARTRRIAAAAAALPEEILVWEILVRLPAKDIFRCRGVCRSWRRITSAPGFFLAHYRRQPSLPLLMLYGLDRTYGTKGGSQIFKHGRPILGFDDYDEFELLLASCDGIPLLSLSRSQFIICNPTTRQCVPLPGLTTTIGRINIAALYLHRLTGEYCVLYWKGRNREHDKAAYYIIMVRRGQLPRCIGAPSDIIPDIEKVMLPWRRTTATNLAPPVVFRNCLHWDPGCNAGILVFDTVAESFRLMRRLAAATRLCTRLCDMEGSIGFSCYDDLARSIIKIWVLADYEGEVWSFKYHVQLPENFNYLHKDTQHLVLSHKGDVLVYMPSGSRILFESTYAYVSRYHVRLLSLGYVRSAGDHRVLIDYIMCDVCFYQRA